MMSIGLCRGICDESEFVSSLTSSFPFALFKSK